MNESLAKQLHKLIIHTKWSLQDTVDEEMKDLKTQLNKIIENHEEK